ncbi:hypothetical protein CEXT_582811 [Caerostris extrusa]|uniref:Uncharacterized protein n=1 Tax=Caerostris extrusa TaxID=172846 RepID=A0AAV4N328_CAEEX|nr:hypothetical protein CEXT_582811 [Caerostris extrusa]
MTRGRNFWPGMADAEMARRRNCWAGIAGAGMARSRKGQGKTDSSRNCWAGIAGAGMARTYHEFPPDLFTHKQRAEEL